MQSLFDYLDTVPELTFMAVIIWLIAVAYCAEWLFRRWTERR